MAEGGSFERTVDGSEICYDFNCSVCISKKSAYSEAACYCPQCHEYFCKRCLFDYGCDHDHFGRGSVAKWGQSSRRYHFDECRQHKTNTVQLYCPRDDVVCCAVCGQTDHKSCGDLKYIPLVADGQMDKATRIETVRALTEVNNTADHLSNDRRSRLTDLKALSKNMEQEIRDKKAQAIARLNKLEQQSLDELNKLETDLADRFTSEIDTYENIKSEISEAKQKLAKSDMDEYLAFSRVKMSKEIVKEKQRILSEMSTVTINDKIQFKVHTKLGALGSLQSFGSFVTEASANTDTLSSPVKSATNTKLIAKSKTAELNKPYTANKRSSFSIEMKEDTYKCIIRGMCQLHNGSIVVADFGNRKLKLLDSTYKVVYQLPLGGAPNDVCNTETGEIAVALQNRDGIQFVSVGDEMVATCKFSATHNCWSIDYHSNLLYVASHLGKHVYVYTPSGSLQQTISTDQHGKDLFSDTTNITINRNCKLIFIADGNTGLVILDLEGNHINTFKPPALSQGAQSICVDEVGNVFVTSYGLNNILHVETEGDRQVQQVLSTTKGIHTGKLCFDNINSRLLVSYHERETVTVLTMSQ